MAMTSGAKFYKADFHIHTPKSSDYKDKTIKANEIVSEALSKGLDIIAITDHNSAEWVDVVRSAAKGANLAVFPGVEITTPLCHLLAIFDSETPKNVLDDLLSSVSISSDKRGREDAVSEDLESVLTKISDSGGVSIAAHANSDKGLLQEGSGQYGMRIFHRDDLAAIEFTQEQHVRKFTRGEVSGYVRRACVQSSDAHSLREIGRRFTFLKMDGVTLRGIKQSLLDYEIRVRFAWEAPSEPAYPQILSISIDQGFFEGESFRFHPSLNCFVGGRGVGKSTVVEFLRYGFGDISSIEDISEDTHGKISTLLGEGGSISVQYLDSDGEIKAIETEYSVESPRRTFKDSAGNPTELISPPVFFSQGELARIASTPLAQMELLDRYLDLGEDFSSEATSVEELKANADRLQDAINQEKKIVDEVENPDVGLVASKSAYESLEKTLKDPVLTEFPKWESEERYVSGIVSALDNLMGGFDKAVDSLEVTGQFPGKLAQDSPNYELFQFVDDVVATIEASAETLKTGFRTEIESKKTDILEILQDWNHEVVLKREQYESTLEGLGEQDVRRAQGRLRNLRVRLDDLERKEKRLKQFATQKQQFQLEREDLLEVLAQSRDSRFQKRREKIAEWQSSFQGKIRLQVTPSSNRQEYLEGLKGLVRGSRLRDADLSTVINKVSPRELVSMFISGDSSSLAAKAGLRVDICQKLIFALQENDLRDVLGLEVILMEDALRIEYEVEPSRYKSLNELSVGGKGTVILSLALIEGDAPLIIDQPEEPLDTLAIHEQIVGTLRKQKESRQFIFTTHNPNVAVGGDAELNYVLEASADQGRGKSRGGVDHEDTNRLLLHHLEGGILAFDLRRKKYIQ